MGNNHSNLEYRENAGRNRTIDRLRRSVRASFRKRKRDSTKWGDDEIAVRNSVCNFPVKYLGCLEVYESRGMQTCEDALEELRKSRKHPIRATLNISGDGIRVVEDETKGLLVDQTIEKVSFCAPDRNNDRGFSYICREGTTRRWMCYGFHAVRDSGERLSHAVGCAFSVCLEKKTNRDKESVAFVNSDSSTFIRTGSFRQTTLTERLTDPQQCKPAEPPPLKPVTNPHAVARPHATTSLLQRQASCHRFGKLDRASPFKRQLSLRISDLPSTQARQQAMCLAIDKQPPIAEVSPMTEIPYNPANHVKKEPPLTYNNDSFFISNSLENCAGDSAPAVLCLQEQITVMEKKETVESKNPFLPLPDSSDPNISAMSDQPLNSTSKNELAAKTLYELAQELQTHSAPANDISQPGDFDKKWTALDNSGKSTSNTIKTFEVQM